MQANPIWPVETRRPALESNLNIDVLVVGGGMAGISCARSLKKAGRDVAVVTKDEVGGPATGASSGVLYYGSGLNYVPSVKLFGKEAADAMWRETAEVIEEIKSAARDESIDCGIRSCGAIMVAQTQAELKEIQEEYQGLNKLGMPVRLLSPEEVRESYPKVPFLGGLAYDQVGQVHPARLASGLAERQGLRIYENTPAEGWDESKDSVTVRTPKGQVNCSNLVVATNLEPFLGLEEHFDTEGSVILASTPTDRVKDVFPEEKILWTMDEKYDIVYPRGDRLILELYALGEEQQKLKRWFPDVDFVTDKVWGEDWSKPGDLAPMVGMVTSRVAVAKGMGDQGIIMSWLSGKKMPGILAGKADWFTKLAYPLRFGPAKLKATMVAAPMATEFQKFADVSEIKPGKIKVSKLGGVEIWVANIEGQFYAHPNKCTHQAGPVGRGRLNGNVIQCPNHGSRFDVKTGAVVGGPANRPLPSLEVKVENSAVWVRLP